MKYKFNIFEIVKGVVVLGLCVWLYDWTLFLILFLNAIKVEATWKK